MRYSADSESARRAMLDALGVSDVETLFASIPPEHRCRDPLEVRGPIPEGDLLQEVERASPPRPRAALVGAGLYQHYVPAAADALVSRSEWLTSYTPYQPEISQGTLVMYYEFLTWVSLLTGQEIANSGMYDGSTATAEAVLMARRLRRKAGPVLVSEALHPEYRAVLDTYLKFQDIEVRTLPFCRKTGRTIIDLPAGEQRDALAVVIQSPNFLGCIEDLEGLDEDAFLISVATEAQSMALLEPLPASIAVGEMQSLGIPMQLGGPTAGFFATSKKHVRQMPGRLVARSRDRNGREAFCITLATREQFIRREKATSNICTSSGLMCLRSVVYMALLGSDGLRRVARTSARAARVMRAALEDVGCETSFSTPFFNEFTVDLSNRPGLWEGLRRSGIVLGVPLARWFPDLEGRYLVALTEVHQPVLDDLIAEVRRHANDS